MFVFFFVMIFHDIYQSIFVIWKIGKSVRRQIVQNVCHSAENICQMAYLIPRKLEYSLTYCNDVLVSNKRIWKSYHYLQDKIKTRLDKIYKLYFESHIIMSTSHLHSPQVNSVYHSEIFLVFCKTQNFILPFNVIVLKLTVYKLTLNSQERGLITKIRILW